MTFADAAEKGRERDGGHSQVAITDLGMVPVERLHPRVAYSPSRPYVGVRPLKLTAAKRSLAATGTEAASGLARGRQLPKIRDAKYKANELRGNLTPEADLAIASNRRQGRTPMSRRE